MRSKQIFTTQNAHSWLQDNNDIYMYAKTHTQHLGDDCQDRCVCNSVHGQVAKSHNPFQTDLRSFLHNALGESRVCHIKSEHWMWFLQFLLRLPVHSFFLQRITKTNIIWLFSETRLQEWRESHWLTLPLYVQVDNMARMLERYFKSSAIKKNNL